MSCHGRTHSSGKGMSSSALSYKRNPPSWLKITPKRSMIVFASWPIDLGLTRLAEQAELQSDSSFETWRY
ncbi:hypothetical protein R1sor_005284 [Riccia sorocarpa]|uniref:Small ribosomal subunit protein uS15 N-terminal domain-containing protein n=1 Tax=Riccia sorocarpa TaxID=122646 RepID=A0ABD3HJP5_9MARC